MKGGSRWGHVTVRINSKSRDFLIPSLLIGQLNVAITFFVNKEAVHGLQGIQGTGEND